MDEDLVPEVFEGHLDKQQCTELALDYGKEYNACSVVECLESEAASFFASYSMLADPAYDEDGTILGEHRGYLTIWFYHLETKQAPTRS